MAKTNTKPEVRFAGFSENWKVKKAKELCSISTGKSNTQDNIKDGKYPFYVRSPIIERSNKFLFDEEAVLTVGDGVGTGKVHHYVNGKYDLHQRVYRMFDFNGVTGKYFYLFFSNNFQARVTTMTAKSSVDSVRLEMIAEMQIKFPEIDEQKLIGNFFENLDNLITEHQQKHSKLKSLKKAMLDKMFPKQGQLVPEIRFKGFEGEWKLFAFKDIADLKRGLTYSPSNVTNNSGVKVLRSSNINEGKFVQREDDVFVKKEAINISFANEQDILITAANGSSRLVGKHALVSKLNCKAVHGGFMLLASAKHSFFLNAYMYTEWYNKFVNQFTAGGSGSIGNLNKIDLEQQMVLVPSEDEQIIIGNYFKNFDEIIDNHKIQITKLQNIKKAFLAKMFI